MDENDLKGLANSLIQQVNEETQQLNQKNGFTQDDHITPIDAGGVLPPPASTHTQQPLGDDNPFSNNAPLTIPNGMALPDEFGGGVVNNTSPTTINHNQPVHQPVNFVGSVPKQPIVQPDLQHILVRNLLSMEKNLSKQTELVKGLQVTVDELHKKIDKLK